MVEKVVFWGHIFETDRSPVLGSSKWKNHVSDGWSVSLSVFGWMYHNRRNSKTNDSRNFKVKFFKLLFCEAVT